MGELQIAALPTFAIPYGAEINRGLAGSEIAGSEIAGSDIAGSDIAGSDIAGSDIEGGVYLSDLPYGTRLELETVHHTYSLVNHGEGMALISGHPEYCPAPVEVLVSGSNWGGSLLKSGFVGRGMRLEFLHPDHDLVTTSRVRSIRQLP